MRKFEDMQMCKCVDVQILNDLPDHSQKSANLHIRTSAH